jgi:carbon storage regulator
MWETPVFFNGFGGPSSSSGGNAMLVLSRKLNDSIQIDSDIRVTVVSIGKGRVKLGISAPDHVHIVRSELVHFAPVMDWVEEVCTEQAKTQNKVAMPL